MSLFHKPITPEQWEKHKDEIQKIADRYDAREGYIDDQDLSHCNYIQAAHPKTKPSKPKEAQKQTKPKDPQ